MAGCGLDGQAAPTPTPIAIRTSSATGTSLALVAKAAPTPTATPAVKPLTLLVGGTGGDGVYLRRSPGDGERIKAWPDGAKMTVIGVDRIVGGKTWKNVRDPDGNEGWVLGDYLVPER
jgi:SH3-like domain-containing protein